jgi:hypothetical protein
MDRRLSLWQRIHVQMHLLMCRFCTRFLKQTQFLRRMARQFLQARQPGADDGIVLSNEARERIKRSLNERKN